MKDVTLILGTAVLVSGCLDSSDSARQLGGPLAQVGSGDYEVINLGTLDTTRQGGSMATAVNNLGQVVGWSRTGAEARDPNQCCVSVLVEHAFFWENGFMKDLGTLGGWESLSRATNINDRGQVVGWTSTPANERHAFFWENGVMTDLGTLGGGFSIPSGLNESGDVVGTSTTASGATHAFLWRGGMMQDLGTLGGSSSAARAVNAAGQVVGESQTASGETHAFLWDGTLQDLGTLGGTTSSATAIAETGQITGSSTDAAGAQHAFVWSHGVMQNLGLLPGFAASGGVLVNAQGAVTGQATNQRFGPRHAFFWAHGVMQDLGTFGGPNTDVMGVDARGRVVGTSTNAASVLSWRAFVWEDGVLRDLGALPGHSNAQANAVNSRGDVVGRSLLDPTSDLKRATLWRRIGG
jgi:probable HAF family extracellular repeat protein